MAETLTFDNTVEQTSADSLTADEQDSLQVGEQIQEQEEQLLAGKYENAQELEKAYIELQKKMGSNDEAEEGEAEETSNEQQDEPPMEITPAVVAITEAADQFEKTGKLTDETLAKFSEMSSQDVVSTYMEMYQKAQEMAPATPASEDLSDSQVNTIQNSVGGEANYHQLLDWATDNMPSEQMESFDNIVASSDANAIQLAVSGLKAQYDNVNGYEGRMLSGKAPRSSGDVFRSQAEVVAAMSDPRYDADPAYRQDLIQKLDRSDVDF
jgi:uncharacterized membrane protein